MLCAVDGGSDPLHVAVVSQRDHHILFLNQVFDIDVVFRDGQLAAPFVAVFFAYLADLGFNHFHQQVFVRQNRGQPLDGLLQLLVFLLELFPLQSGQACQAHIQDRLGLSF